MRASSSPQASRSGSAPIANVTRSAVRAAKSMTRGPDAATSRGTFGAPLRASHWSRLGWPSQSTVPPARYAWSSDTRARNSATGSGGRPRWNRAVSPRPMPRTKRPPDVSCTVAATVASAAGWRVAGFVTPVANRNVEVSAAPSAAATKGSPTRFCESVKAMPSQPCRSARVAWATARPASGIVIVQSSIGPAA